MALRVSQQVAHVARRTTSQQVAKSTSSLCACRCVMKTHASAEMLTFIKLFMQKFSGVQISTFMWCPGLQGTPQTSRVRSSDFLCKDAISPVYFSTNDCSARPSTSELTREDASWTFSPLPCMNTSAAAATSADVNRGASASSTDAHVGAGFGITRHCTPLPCAPRCRGRPCTPVCAKGAVPDVWASDDGHAITTWLAGTPGFQRASAIRDNGRDLRSVSTTGYG